jgi:hypothetical protein
LVLDQLLLAGIWIGIGGDISIGSSWASSGIGLLAIIGDAGRTITGSLRIRTDSRGIFATSNHRAAMSGGYATLHVQGGTSSYGVRLRGSTGGGDGITADGDKPAAKNFRI